jgi:hypothetical protein
MAGNSLAIPVTTTRWSRDGSTRWIVGRGVDLTLVIGSALAGYLYLVLHVAFHIPISWLWWFWSVGFDGTHIFATASRTYFDREAMRRDGPMMIGGLVFFFALGPILVLAGLRGWLALLVGTWAYYHVVRQHYGFLILYKVKNGDLAKEDHRIDWLFLAVMLSMPPFLRFFVYSPHELGLPDKIALSRIAPWTPWVLWGLAAWVTAAWLARQWTKWRSGAVMNAPKLLLLAGLVPLHWLTFYWMSWQAAVPTVTIVHNLQYHALVWWHNRNRYGDTTSDRHGRIPPAVARSLFAYLGLALVFSLLYRIPGFNLGRISDLAFGFFCGFGLTHYWLDSRIWRVRHDPELRVALRID